MKNLELLNTGSKPAPGQLVIVQGFVNTLNIEFEVDEIGTRQLLRAWLIRHGLLHSSETVSAKDLRAVLSFREALRELLLINNSSKVRPSSLRWLNNLSSQCALVIAFGMDGTPALLSTGYGVSRVFGQILSQVVQAAVNGTWTRLKACDEPNCQWAFYDGSKNRSGRWCSMSVCGNREKARAYRRRRSGRQ
jgi:predicted RNA-binding Zn ribbon-like protein